MSELDLTEALPQRFWDKVTRVPDGCWTWTGAKTGRGYGRLWSNGDTVQAHRVAYEALVAPIPPGLVIDHLCRNHACVNPAHMEPVKPGENTRRGLKGYGARALCKRGEHDITDPANVHVAATTGNRQCLPCLRRSWADKELRKRIARGDAR